MSVEQSEKQLKVWAGQSASRVESYWNYPSCIKRSEWFSRQLEQYEFSSIFEVGVFSGRNLKYIADVFTKVRIGGIDVNAEAIKFAKDKLPAAELDLCSVYDVDTDDKWDIVFTVGVMIHIPPDGIEKAIDKCLEKASKFVIHMESISNDNIINGPAEVNPSNKIKNKLQWWPDLVKRYKSRGYDIITNVSVPYYRKTHPFRMIVVKK